MEHIIDLENASINSLLAERTIIHWQDIPEFAQLIEPVNHLDDVPTLPSLAHLLGLVELICQSDEEQSNKQFLLLESYCSIADSETVSLVISSFILEGSESYPTLTTKATGWLAWALDYKPELERKGRMVKRLWKLAQWRGEDVVKLRDGNEPRMLENQQLILANLLDRIFYWMESKEYEESIEQLKERVAYYTKTPELLIFAMDTILRYLDGRWSRSSIKEEGVRPKQAGLSLMEINQERSPIHYLSLNTPGPFGFPDNKAGTRGKSLKEREIPVNQGRSEVDKEYEISDLVAQCLEGHEPETTEQLLRSFILHIGIRVDTVMVSASSAVAKHAAQQRDKILMRLIAENPVYRRIITSAMNQVPWLAASICLPLIQAMLRCAIAHWNNCKNILPQAYPKELEEAVWVAQLAEHTGLVPSPINEAVVLFPLINSKDIGLILEQCYYVVLVKNADMLQQQQKHQSQQLEGPEISLITKLIFKHAKRTVHLMPLFVMASQQA
ncbi:hypothetical protein BGZ80_006973 [Entomortierella chlamydospora]|uniref:Uncharacterized protein n=1 Tax=Entomortierella chlamydospora TaxID=101097 RepID=A0A9P6N3L9_9FUNG|nr:hypothetical protein BGZ80_006973 [Entomortierella chlamydospora]